MLLDETYEFSLNAKILSKEFFLIVTFLRHFLGEKNDLSFQPDAKTLPHGGLDGCHQGYHLSGRSSTPVDDKIGVLVRNLGRAKASALPAGFFDEPACRRATRGIFEDTAAGTGMGRLPGPAFLQ